MTKTPYAADFEEYGVPLNFSLVDFLANYGSPKLYNRGDFLVREGDPSTFVLLVTVGAADILKVDPDGAECVIATVGKGDIIGEMGVFLDLRRSASIRAKTAMTALWFDNPTFLFAVEKAPELALRLLKTLSQRVARMSDRLTTAVHAQVLLSTGIALLRRFAEAEVNPDDFRFDLKKASAETGLSLDRLRLALEELQKRGAVVRGPASAADDVMTLQSDLYALFRVLLKVSQGART